MMQISTALVMVLWEDMAVFMRSPQMAEYWNQTIIIPIALSGIALIRTITNIAKARMVRSWELMVVA